MIQVLILDAEAHSRAALCTHLATPTVRLHPVATLEAARQALSRTPCHVLIATVGTTTASLYDCLTLCSHVKQQMPSSTVVLQASEAMAETIVQALRPELYDHLITGPAAHGQILSLVQHLERRQSLRYAKIVCTIGPASESEAVLAQLIAAGMNVARLNFSHGDHDWHRTLCDRLRRLSEHVAIMADLQGPKMRIGSMQDERVVTLEAGAQFTLTTRPIEGTAEAVPLDYQALPREVEAGDTLYLNDGLIALEVQEVRADTDIICQVVTGGLLSSRKGIHAPGAALSSPIPTPKDRQDLAVAAELGVDFIAVSFVTAAADLHRVRATLTDIGADIPLISKIERAMALEHISSILEASDGMMVARGDLAVNIRPEEVPRHQKAIIRQCNQQGKPVICATQMLESMHNRPLPTRAEVSDVFNAILDGADAVMLSGESAVGDYPVESVRMMERIVRSAEATLSTTELSSVRPMASPSEIIGHGIATMMERFTHHKHGITAILAITREGHSARMIAKYHPDVPIIAATHSRQIARQLVLSRGIMPMLIEEELSEPSTMTRTAILQAVQEELLCREDTVLTVSGSGWAPQSPTNVIGLFTVQDVLEDKAPPLV